MDQVSRDKSGVPLVELRQVTKLYGKGDAAVWALGGIHLQIAAGELVAIMGPSGSGKSTAMHIMGCLDVPTTGASFFCGIDTSALASHERAMLRRHFLGFVFQDAHLLPRVSAAYNVELPLIYRGIRAAERK